MMTVNYPVQGIRKKHNPDSGINAVESLKTDFNEKKNTIKCVNVIQE
jgi:hypothetical protein